MDMFKNFYNCIMTWLQDSSSAMDLQTLIICSAVFIISALVVYAISVYGMRERTYEEAIEEQRRRNKEAMEQAKNEKNKKEKKFKKWGKKNRERDDDKSVINEEMEEKRTEQTEDKQKPKPSQKKKRKQKKATTKECLPHPSSSEETDEQISYSSSCNDQKIDFPDANTLLESASVDNERIKFDNDAKKDLDIRTEQIDASTCGGADIPSSGHKGIAVQPKSPSKGKKKNKSDIVSSPSKSSELSVAKILPFLKSGVFTEEEIYLLMDVLSSKQSGVGGWTKKNDPIPGLKKQIQEKEEALEAEQRLTHATNEKLKSLRQEFHQEKSRAMATERSLRDKVNHQQKEIQNLHSTLQMTHEQHVADLQAKIQQVKTKLNEEHSVAIQRLKEENKQLQAMNHLESEKQQRSGLEIAHLKREIDKMRAALETTEGHNVSLQAINDDLLLKIKDLERKLDKVVRSRTEDEYTYTKKISQLNIDLQQADKSHDNLVQDLQNTQSLCNSLEVEKSTLRKRLEEAKHQMNSSEQERIKLQARLEDLLTCIDQIRGEVVELNKEKNEHLKQIQELNKEKESLAVELAEKLEQHGTDRVLQVSVADDQAVHRTLHDIEELEKTIQEKDYIIQHLLLQFEDSAQQENMRLIEEYKWKVHSLTKEIENQKESNEEMRQSYQDATEALRNATHKAEMLEGILKSTESAIQSDDKSSNSDERFEEQLKEAQFQIEVLQRDADKRVHFSEEAAKIQIEKLQENLYQRISEITAEADAKVLKAEKDKEVFMLKLRSLDRETRKCLLKLFPNIRLGGNLETVLHKIQYSVEKEEKNWREEMLTKEKNWRKELSTKEKNWKEELSTKEMNLREMQFQLIKLQKKLQVEEEEKQVLNAKYDEALAKIALLEENLKIEQNENMIMKAKACAMAFSPGTACGEVFPPLTELPEGDMREIPTTSLTKDDGIFGKK